MSLALPLFGYIQTPPQVARLEIAGGGEVYVFAALSKPETHPVQRVGAVYRMKRFQPLLTTGWLLKPLLTKTNRFYNSPQHLLTGCYWFRRGCLRDYYGPELRVTDFWSEPS